LIPPELSTYEIPEKKRCHSPGINNKNKTNKTIQDSKE